jgi:WS/DGAT/MGAT family acyltransferase
LRALQFNDLRIPLRQHHLSYPSGMHPKREPMSGVDLAWLRMERTTNPMAIVGVLICRDRLRREALLELLRERLLRFERFRLRPVHDALGSYWQADENFDLDAHLQTLVLPARAGQRQLEAAVGELASTQLDPQRPLWQMHLVERYRKGSVLIARFHHCYADGIALLEVFASLTDPNRHGAPVMQPIEPAADDDPAWRALPFAATAAATLARVQGIGQSALDLLGSSLHALAHPEQTLAATQQIGAAGAELAALSMLGNDPATPLKAPLGKRKQIAWADPLPLREIKTIAGALGCTINDVLLSCVAGALGAHLASVGHPIDGLTVRALVPVNLRTAGGAATLGNHFGLVFVELPLGERNPLARVYAVHQHMEQLKHSSQAAASLWLLTALGALPGAMEERSIELFTGKASLVISNVPGPRQTRYIAGARIDRQFFWVPQAGSIGLGISLFSYDDAVHCGVMSDRNLIAEPRRLAERFGKEFEQLLLTVIAGPLSSAGDAGHAPV